MLVRVISRPLQPSNENPMDPAALGKETLYSLGSVVAGGFTHLGGRSLLFWAWLWDISNPAIKSILR